MKKTIVLLLFMFVVSGSVFSACGVANAPAPDTVADPTTVPSPTSAPVESVKPQETVSEPKVTLKYVDGVYTQTGAYQSPAGPESIKVTVSVKDDFVSSVTVVSNAVNEGSKQYQALFIDGINSLVVGKKLSDVAALGQVNGSSLTPKGFQQALASIKSDALAKN